MLVFSSRRRRVWCWAFVGCQHPHGTDTDTEFTIGNGYLRNLQVFAFVARIHIPLDFTAKTLSNRSPSYQKIPVEHARLSARLQADDDHHRHSITPLDGGLLRALAILCPSLRSLALINQPDRRILANAT